MAKVDPLSIEQAEAMRSEIREVHPGIWKGPWLPDLYDNRSECLRENVQENQRRLSASKGMNKWGQTPEQEHDMAERKKITDKLKEKARIAELIAMGLTKDEVSEYDASLIRSGRQPAMAPSQTISATTAVTTKDKPRTEEVRPDAKS